MTLRSDTLSARTTSEWARPHIDKGVPPYRYGGKRAKKSLRDFAIPRLPIPSNTKLWCTIGKRLERDLPATKHR